MKLNPHDCLTCEGRGEIPVYGRVGEGILFHRRCQECNGTARKSEGPQTTPEVPEAHAGGNIEWTLTRREISTLIRLLGVLQGELKVSIDSHTPPATEIEEGWVKGWQREQKAAEELAKKLDAARRAKG